MQKLLITYGTRPLAQRLSKILLPEFEVFLATSEEIPSFLSSNFPKIPTGANPTFAHEMLKLSLDKQIDFLLPLGLPEIQSLANSKILFEEYGIEVLSPNTEVLETLFVLENPASSVPMSLLWNGKSLNGTANYSDSLSGLYAISDEGDEVALCTV